MKHLQLRALLRPACLGLAVAAALLPAGPTQAAGAIRAAYVETVLPARPFSAVFQPNAGAVSAGPSSGALGVTSLTITSFGTSQSATMVLKLMSLPDGVNCGGAGTVVTDLQQRVLLRIPPSQTVHLTYPSPWVISSGMAVPVGQHLCLAGEQLGGDGPIYIHVNGFVQ